MYVRSAGCAHTETRAAHARRMLAVSWRSPGARAALLLMRVALMRRSALNTLRAVHTKSSEPHRGGSGRALSRASPARPPGWLAPAARSLIALRREAIFSQPSHRRDRIF